MVIAFSGSLYIRRYSDVTPVIGAGRPLSADGSFTSSRENDAERTVRFPHGKDPRSDGAPQHSRSTSTSDVSPALSESSLFISSSSSSSSSSELDGSDRKDITEAKSEVEDVISRLIRLSASIRQSGSLHRDSKADRYIDRDEDGNDLTAQFANITSLVIDHKFPDADEAIRNRLAQSIARRRNRFAYRRKHQQKLARPYPLKQQLPTLLPPGLGERVPAPALPRKSIALPAISEPNLQRLEPTESLPSHTSATLLDPERFKIPSKPTSSKASTVLSGTPTQAATLSFPRAPQVGKNDFFECPYCYIVCPAKEARGKYWK